MDLFMVMCVLFIGLVLGFGLGRGWERFRVQAIIVLSLLLVLYLAYWWMSMK